MAFSVPSWWSPGGVQVKLRARLSASHGERRISSCSILGFPTRFRSLDAGHLLRSYPYAEFVYGLLGRRSMCGRCRPSNFGQLSRLKTICVLVSWTKLVGVQRGARGLKPAVADFLPARRARNDFLQNLSDLLRRH